MAFSNPTQFCVEFLYRISMGFTTIQRLTKIHKGRAYQWAKLSRYCDGAKNVRTKARQGRNVLIMSVILILGSPENQKNQCRFPNPISRWLQNFK